jgi:hypothetical protein
VWVTGLDTEPPLEGAFNAGWQARDGEVDRLKGEIMRRWLAPGDGRFVSGCQFCGVRARWTSAEYSAEQTPHEDGCIVRAILTEAVVRNVGGG